MRPWEAMYPMDEYIHDDKTTFSQALLILGYAEWGLTTA